MKVLSFIVNLIGMIIVSIGFWILATTKNTDGLFYFILGMNIVNIFDGLKSFLWKDAEISKFFKPKIHILKRKDFLKEFGLAYIILGTTASIFSIFCLIDIKILVKIGMVLVVLGMISYSVILIHATRKYNYKKYSSFAYDPIEDTKEYKKVMKEIQPILDREFSEPWFGMCHGVWSRKKQLLAERGIDWKTPQEMNPGTKFD